MVLVENGTFEALVLVGSLRLFLLSVFLGVAKWHGYSLVKLTIILLWFKLEEIVITFLIAFLCSFGHKLNNFNQIENYNNFWNQQKSLCIALGRSSNRFIGENGMAWYKKMQKSKNCERL